MAEYQLKYTGEEIDAALDKANSALQEAPVTSVNGATGDVILNVRDGRDGRDGKDGVSPTVDVNQSGNMITITVTDAEGTKEAIIMTGNGGDYTLPTASASVLGGVKVGAGLTINSSGVLSATGDGGAAESVDWENVQNKPSAFPATEHTHNTEDVSGLARVAMTGSYDDLIDKPTGSGDFILPEATREMLGGVKVGNGLSIDSGVLSVNDPVKLWPPVDGETMVDTADPVYMDIPGIGDYNILVFRTGYGEIIKPMLQGVTSDIYAGGFHVMDTGVFSFITLRLVYHDGTRGRGPGWWLRHCKRYNFNTDVNQDMKLTGIYGLYKRSGTA